MKLSAITLLCCVIASGVNAIPFVGKKPGDIVPGKIFVELKDTLSKDGQALTHILRRFSANRRSEQVPVIEKTISVEDYTTFVVKDVEGLQDYLTAHPQIQAVHPNRILAASDVQKDSTWGLARISARNAPAEKVYVYPTQGGSTVDVYVVDTGVQVEHPEFEGRAVWGASFVDDGKMIDGNGHGTHVAGTIGSKSYGVAKKTNIIAVRVLNSAGQGTTESVVSGMQWAVDQAKKTKRKSVMNMSLGGPTDSVLDAVAAQVVAGGVHLVAAAGNSNADACKFSPARVPEVLTVGAIDSTDKRTMFSNIGPCVDIFAPGARILSTWNNNRTNTIDGTSMASPHTAGVVALVLGENSFPSVDAAFQYVKQIATLNRLTGIKGANNAILYNGVVPGADINSFPSPAPVVCKIYQCWFMPECDQCVGLF